METKYMSFIAACKDYFGMKEGQTLSDFMTEIKALTTQDREDLKKEFARIGYQISA